MFLVYAVLNYAVLHLCGTRKWSKFLLYAAIFSHYAVFGRTVESSGRPIEVLQGLLQALDRMIWANVLMLHEKFHFYNDIDDKLEVWMNETIVCPL